MGRLAGVRTAGRGRSGSTRSERRRESRVGSIVQALRRAIMMGTFPPGAFLYEGDLAQRFGVSKTPVREALGVLRAQGFIEVVPHRGYFVSPISLHDVRDVLEARVVLEGATAALAAERVTDEELRALETLARDDLTHRNETADERFDWMQRNKQFHLAVARAARNGELVRLLDTLLDKASRVIFLYYARAVLEAHRPDHLALVEALASRDPERARAAMRAHIERVGAAALRLLHTGP